MLKLLKPLFQYFEQLTAAFPEDETLYQAPPKTLSTFFLYHLKGYGKIFILLGIFSVIYAVMEVSLFAFLGRLVDWLSQQDRETFLQTQMGSLIGMAVMVVLLLPLVSGVSNLLQYQSIMANFPMAVRWRSHRYLLEQSLSFYQDEFAGRVSAKVLQTALAVRETLMKIVQVMIYIGVYFFSMLIILLNINGWLMLPMLTWFAIYVSLLRYFLPRLRAISQEQAHKRSSMTGRIVDAYSNIATVKLFSHTQKEASYAKTAMNGFLQNVHQQMRMVNLFIFLVEFFNYLLIFSVAATGIFLWFQQSITTGAIAIAVAMAMRLNGMSRWIMFEVSRLFESIGTVTDGINSLAIPHAVTDHPAAKALVISRGEIDFEQVNFSYQKPQVNTEKAEEQSLAVINNLNLHIKAGERIGLVGRSGAGKSTLVNALLRFYDLQSGKILVDGQDIAQLKQDSLRAQIAMVTQDTALLHRSVRENILYGKPDATEAELQAAIKQAKADEFIQQLSDPKGNTGLDAQVGERGVKLSGGQRQRIAIARVLLKNAPILILDEATSALDSEVEAAIQESLTGLMENKTVIAIAHRLSTIAALDRLVVLDQGRIIEQGTHAELLAKKGIYAKLWAHQTGGFLGDDV